MMNVLEKCEQVQSSSFSHCINFLKSSIGLADSLKKKSAEQEIETL